MHPGFNETELLRFSAEMTKRAEGPRDETLRAKNELLVAPGKAAARFDVAPASSEAGRGAAAGAQQRENEQGAAAPTVPTSPFGPTSGAYTWAGRQLGFVSEVVRT
jgi:hypothetical protein